MGYSLENGYTPMTFETAMDYVRQGVNAQFQTEYTVDSFKGSGFYKMFYAPVQEIIKQDIKTSEIFLKLQDYFRTTNERISRPVSTPVGLIDKFAEYDILVSVKPVTSLEAGMIFVCADVDNTDPNYADTKLLICTILKDSTAIGNPTQGTEVETLVLTNGQSFDYKFNLPTRTETLIRLTVTTSQNNRAVIASPEDIRFKVLQNITERYRLGLNFEPQKYYDIDDAPWASEILLEYSIDDGVTWDSQVAVLEYNELMTIALEDIVIIQN